MGSELASDCCIQNSPTCQQLLITPACPDDQDDDDVDIDLGDGNIDVDGDDGVFLLFFFREVILGSMFSMTLPHSKTVK